MSEFKSVDALKDLLTTAEEKQYKKFFNKMQHDNRFEKLIQAMTTDRLRGGSSLKKYRI